jgi:hypothetical protein
MKTGLFLLAFLTWIVCVQGQDYPVPESRISIAVERKSAHPFLAEFDRLLVLKRDGVEIIAEQLYMDTGSDSLANLYLLRTGAYLLVDMNGGWFEVDAGGKMPSRAPISAALPLIRRPRCLASSGPVRRKRARLI